MVRAGSSLPFDPTAKDEIRSLSGLVTHTSPWPTAIELGWSSAVLGPDTVAIGVALPSALAAYSVIESFPALLTNSRPLELIATPDGAASPVSGPVIVAIGASLPAAPWAYSERELPVLSTVQTVP